MTDAQQRFWFPCDGEGFAIGDVQNYDPKTENMLVQLHVDEGKKVHRPRTHRTPVASTAHAGSSLTRALLTKNHNRSEMPHLCTFLISALSSPCPLGVLLPRVGRQAGQSTQPRRRRR